MVETYQTYKDLVGVTMRSVTGKKDDERMEFTTEDGRCFAFYHEQDCCESVSIEDITGDVEDLVGVPILEADETIRADDDAPDAADRDDSNTWTFYRFTTIKGTVVVRWHGHSNGYYSERVAFSETTPVDG